MTLTPQEEKIWQRIQEKFEEKFIPWIYRALNESNDIGVLASTSVSSVGNINYDMESNILGPLRTHLVAEFQKVTATLDTTERELLNHLSVITQKILEAVNTEDNAIKASIQRVLGEIITTIKSNSRVGYEKIHQTSIKISNSIHKEIEDTTKKLVTLTENLQKDSEELVEIKKIESYKLTNEVKKNLNETTEEVKNEMNEMIQETQVKSINLLLHSMNKYEVEIDIMTRKMKNSLKKNGDVFMEIAISCVWIYLMFMICFEMLPSKNDMRSLDYKRVVPMVIRRVLQVSPSSFIFPGLFLLFEYKFENLNQVGLETKLYIILLLVSQTVLFSSLFLVALMFQSILMIIGYCRNEKPLEKLEMKFESLRFWNFKRNDKNEGKIDYESNEFY